MGTAPPATKQFSEYAEDAGTNSTCMKLMQLWLTSFAIGIPSLRLLFFFDFQHYEIILAVFFTMLVFGSMYILDESDRLWRIDDIEPCSEVIVADGEHLNDVLTSSNHQNKTLELCGDIAAEKCLPPINETHKPRSSSVIG